MAIKQTLMIGENRNKISKTSTIQVEMESGMLKALFWGIKLNTT